MKKIIPLFLLALTLSACSLLPQNNKVVDPTPEIEPTRPQGQAVKNFSSQEVSLDFYFENNKYLYYGKVTLPNPCYQVQVDALIAESFPEQVTLNIVTQDSGQICVQIISEKVIAGVLQVSKDATFRVKLNGQEVPATK